jgi:tRNA pseudouridine55 synthase
MPEREVTVHRFEEVRRAGAEREFVIECSSGTYVRSLIADLGDAYCTALRRTRIGDFDVADADPDCLLPLEQALLRIPGAESLSH